MTAGGGTQVLAGHGGVHGPGHQAVIADTDGDVLFYHYYADNGASLLGINRSATTRRLALRLLTWGSACADPLSAAPWRPGWSARSTSSLTTRTAPR